MAKVEYPRLTWLAWEQFAPELEVRACLRAHDKVTRPPDSTLAMVTLLPFFYAVEYADEQGANRG